jgi:hypothetical protein
MKKDDLQKHVFSTYITMRYGMAIMAFVFPFVVSLVGSLNRIPLQESLSAYYWATAAAAINPECMCTVAPSRDWFVGLLLAISASLYLYKGFSVRENWALNLAGLFGIGVALFPMDWPVIHPTSTSWPWSLVSMHGVFAFAMFFCLAYVACRRFKETLDLLPPESRPGYRYRYYAIAAVMVASPVTAFLINGILSLRAYTFLAETSGIWAFAYYWWTKSNELKQSNATELALKGDLELPER